MVGKYLISCFLHVLWYFSTHLEKSGGGVITSFTSTDMGTTLHLMEVFWGETLPSQIVNDMGCVSGRKSL